MPPGQAGAPLDGVAAGTGEGVSRSARAPRVLAVPVSSSNRNRLAAGMFLTVAGALWTLHAVVLDLRPEGCIATRCDVSGTTPRPTEDLSWLFLVSVLALGVGMWTAVGSEGSRGRVAWLAGTGLVLAGAAVLLLGLVVNALLTGDSPLWWLHDSDSLGRFLPTFGSLAAGIAAIRGHWLARWHGVLLALSVIVSLGFNAQTDRILLTVPLGVAWTLIGLHELLPRRPRDQ